MEKETKNYGKAYAFFDCNASKKEIEAELPTIRKCVKTPSNLELSLTEGVENLKGDNELMTLAKEAKEGGMKYVLEAKYEGSTNKQTADEVAGIMNQAYQTPLYQEGEQFRGAIVYQGIDKYVFRD